MGRDERAGTRLRDAGHVPFGVRLTGTSSTPTTTCRGIGNRPARRFRPARQCRPMREIRPVGERCRDAWLPETMARQFESLAVWRRVSHEGVGRLGQACVYSISGETQSRHCWWLMLAISLAHSMSGGATAGHSRTVASLLAEARWCPSGLNATLTTARVWPGWGTRCTRC